MTFLQTITIPKRTRAGLELRTLRERCGLSQVNAAKRLGISQGTLSRIERGFLDAHFEVGLFKRVFKKGKK